MVSIALGSGEADYCNLVSMYAYMHLAFKEHLQTLITMHPPPPPPPPGVEKCNVVHEFIPRDPPTRLHSLYIHTT